MFYMIRIELMTGEKETRDFRDFDSAFVFWEGMKTATLLKSMEFLECSPYMAFFGECKA